jgi:hypothetical protein
MAMAKEQKQEEEEEEDHPPDPYTTLDSLPCAVQILARGISIHAIAGTVKSLAFRHSHGFCFSSCFSSSCSVVSSDRLLLPRLQIDDHTERLFLNLLAYESHSLRSKLRPYHILSYLHFMDLLVDTPADVDAIADLGVLSISVDSSRAAALVFNRLCRRSRCVFSARHLRAARALKARCNSAWRRGWAEFYSSNLSRPWLVASFLAAIALFAMTFVIMWYTVLLYRHDLAADE